MPARRCAIGCESWPDEDEYKTCFVCGEPTRRLGNVNPTMTAEDAVARLREAQFQAYLEASGRE